ncbi:MAG: histidinol-phosphatase [Clostridia bacterium]|nr:histidinol-phosphatase [Clostridia bacterium]
MLHNYHTHTKRCKHAVGEDREYVENAVRGGLKTLGFSDHAPYPAIDCKKPSGFRVELDEAQGYVESVRALAKEYEKDIRILCGFELEYYPALHAEEMAYLKTLNPDYLILGQHFIHNQTDGKASIRLETDEELIQYVTQALEGLKTGDFLYFAHPDIPSLQFSKEVVTREYRRLCEGAKALHIPLEINLLGVRDHRQYPSRTFFKIAAEVGNQVVIGCDAHDPNDIPDPASEKIARTMAQELGLQILEKLI